ncbi:hypothetical protein [Salaquimonas pukyongi]|uniref:hypothetical protein n=1 Tax=Salaquimonas pukyongi TaxID=2712698 RepID=UPI0013BE9F2C|nr:hypothetical protein [Salaquimonas pukyongi]
MPLRTAVLLLAALLLSVCGESWNWHQKLTVTVETPQGEKSGSAVQQVTWKNDTLVPGSPGGRAVNGLRGEAAVVELGSGRYLFALINGAATLAQHVVLDPAMAKAPFEERGAALEQVGRKGTVPRKYIPQLVTFSNIDNPASVKAVDPDDLAATFGPGYRLKSVTLEITDEPVTDGEVEKVLGWLKDVWPNQLDGQRYERIDAANRSANSLSTGNFTSESFK